MAFVYFLANSARNGAMKRHGPHQEAVKSTTIWINKKGKYMLNFEIIA